MGVLYDLKKKKHSKLSILSNTMVSRTTTISFKHDGTKRGVRVLPPESTNNSIISITPLLPETNNDPVVDLVASCTLPKKRVNDHSKLLEETSKEAQVEVDSRIRTTSTGTTINNINNDTDPNNFGENVNGVSNQTNNKYCLSPKKNSTTSIPNLMTHYQDIPDPHSDPKSILRLENLLGAHHNNKGFLFDSFDEVHYGDYYGPMEFNVPLTDDNTTSTTSNDTSTNNHIVDNSTPSLLMHNDIDDLNHNNNDINGAYFDKNNVAVDSTFGLESDDNKPTDGVGPNGEYNYDSKKSITVMIVLKREIMQMIPIMFLQKKILLVPMRNSIMTVLVSTTMIKVPIILVNSTIMMMVFSLLTTQEFVI